MKALILENKVVDIAEKEFPVTANMTWLSCGDEVKIGWFYIDGKLKGSDKTDQELLIEAKDLKKQNLNKNWSESLEEPLSSIKAKESGTDNEVYFEFQTKSTGNSLTEPATIIFGALAASGIKYSCKIVEGDAKRKGYIDLTNVVAGKLASHLQVRAITNIQHKNDLYEEIEAIKLDNFDSLEKALDALNKIDIKL